MSIDGYATIEGTERYFKRISRSYPGLFKESWYKSIPSLNINVSRLGFGTYRVHYKVREHVDALREAIISGVNVIDTSTNYGDGASEILVGNVIKELIESHRLFRDEVIVITKAGYIQGKNLKLLLEKKFPETTKMSDELYHCIHPEFLETQIEFSLNRMGLKTIDVFLLHNPEYYLKVYGDKKVYLKRIENAFHFLESLRSRNIIKYYGISSNTFVEPPSHREHTSLIDILKISKNLDGFKVIQFPANLLETGYIEKYYNEQSLLDIAQNHKLWTLANRPFNAIYNNKLYRFARMTVEPDEGDENPKVIMMNLENELVRFETILLKILSKTHFKFDDIYPSPAQTIRYYLNSIEDPDSIYYFIEKVILPFRKTTSYIKFLIEDEYKNEEQAEYLKIFDNYLKILNYTLSFLPKYVLYKNHLKMKPIEEQLSKLHYKLEDLPLSLQVLFILLNQGIDTVLAGMRKIEYVRQLQKIFFLRIPEEKIVVSNYLDVNI